MSIWGKVNLLIYRGLSVFVHALLNLFQCIIHTSQWTKFTSFGHSRWYPPRQQIKQLGTTETTFFLRRMPNKKPSRPSARNGGSHAKARPSSAEVLRAIRKKTSANASLSINLRAKRASSEPYLIITSRVMVSCRCLPCSLVRTV